MSTIVSDGKPYSITLQNVGGQLTADQMERVAEQLAAEWPEYAVTVEHHPGQTAQRALRESTRENLPEVAAALDSGDVTAAMEVFLEHLSEAKADRA